MPANVIVSFTIANNEIDFSINIFINGLTSYPNPEVTQNIVIDRSNNTRITRILKSVRIFTFL